MAETFWQWLPWLPAALVALALHEAAHAYCADYLGDPTPRRLGRVTLNPLAHLDPVGTSLLLIAHFGWGKAVPVDPRHFRRPRRDLVLVACSGPLANLLTAALVATLLRLAPPAPPLVRTSLEALVFVSLVLFLFNMLPVPPLDGSKVLAGWLPATWAARYRRLGDALSWSLLGLVLAGSLTDFNPLAMLLFAPVRALYTWLLGAAAL